MIRPLRSRHRVMIAGLAAVVPLLVVAALAARRPVPRMETLPPAVAVPSIPLEERAWMGSVWEPGLILTASLIRPVGTGDEWLLILEPGADLVHPEVLVYGQPVRRDKGQGLPDGALLIGRLDGDRPVALGLPGAMRSARGRLLFYSLPHDRIVGALDLPQIRFED